MTDTWKSHTVAYDDTVEALAARYLGSAIRWREIVALNKLRWPFISSKPAEWFGPTEATGILADATATNDATTTLVGERASVLRQAAIFFVDGYDNSGQYLYEALPIKDYDPATGLLTFYLPFRYAWPSGTRWVVFAPQRDADVRVARPGESLMIPVPFGQVGAVLLTDADFVQLYGTDVTLTQGTFGGNLVWESGDLTLVRGRDNIKQALRMKSDLPQGTNLFHPEEGNRTHDLLGMPGSPATLLRARSYTAEALARDPRVVLVRRAVARADEDRIEVTVDVELANNPSAVRVESVITTQGG